MQKIDQMYAAFTGQSLEKVQQYTERDRFLSVSEVMFCGLCFKIYNTFLCVELLLYFLEIYKCF